MMPLFESISNAMDAIEDTQRGVTAGKIRIVLITRGDLVQQSGDESIVVDGFEITDDGIGFDSSHMDAFAEAYTMSKVKVGGRGVGRFTFLKVFDKVSISSVFNGERGRKSRHFSFSIEREVAGSEDVADSADSTGTTILMRGLAEHYQTSWPSDPQAIARRIIAHFLIRFAARSCPIITLEAPGHNRIDLQTLFQQSVQPHIEERVFKVSGYQFAIQAFRNSDGRARHEYHLCANGRAVIPAKLKDLLPELPDRFVDDNQGAYTLIVLVTGEYLDEHSNQMRTKIAFRSDEDLELDRSLVARSELNTHISDVLRLVLSADLRTTNEEKIAQIERFVERAPEYRVLTNPKYRALIERRVQPGLGDAQLDEALLHLRRDLEDGVRKEERHVAALIERESFELYQGRIQNLMEEMNDVGKAKLADYVAHRRTILDLVDISLKRV
jgi:hypothetical protein